MFTRLFHISKWQHNRRLGRIRRWKHCSYSTKFGSSREQRPWLMPTKILLYRHCPDLPFSIVRSVNILITFSSPGGFVCSTCRAASHRGRGFPFRLQLAGQGGIARMVIDKMVMMMMIWTWWWCGDEYFYWRLSHQPEVWAYFTNSVRDPVAFVNNKVGWELNPTVTWILVQL